MNQARWLAGLVLGVVLASPAWSQGVSEASGSVTDRNKNPIAGATVSFWAKSNPKVVYTGETSKKGRYLVSGLFSNVENERWDMKVEAPGYVPVEVRVESRNVNKVLIGDVMTAKVSRRMAAPDIMIRPLGHAQVDWIMVPESEAEELALDTGPGALPEASGAPAAAQDPWDEALTLAAKGNLEAAVPLFEKAVEQQPDSAERREALAKVLFRLDQPARAAEQARRATEIDPARTDSWMLLFSVHEQRGELDLAAEALEQARKTAPADVRVLDRLAFVATRRGDRAAAIEAYTEITRLKPENAEAWAALGNLHAEAGDPTASEAAYAKVVALDPQKAYQTYYNLGVLIANRESISEEDSRRAVAVFRKAVEIKPDYAPAWQQLGYALIGLGDNAAAAEALQNYLKAKPGAADAERVRAMIKTLGQ